MHADQYTYTARLTQYGYVGVVYTWDARGDYEITLFVSDPQCSRSAAIDLAADWCEDNGIDAELA